jgi:hypothetical protein
MLTIWKLGIYFLLITDLAFLFIANKQIFHGGFTNKKFICKDIKISKIEVCSDHFFSQQQPNGLSIWTLLFGYTTPKYICKDLKIRNVKDWWIRQQKMSKSFIAKFCNTFGGN